MPDAQPGAERLVSIDAILQRQVRAVSDLQWYGSEHLLAQFNGSSSRKPVSRVISLSGVLDAPLGQGKYPSVSPDARLLVQYTGDRWVVRDIADRTAYHIEEPVDENRDFQPYLRPVWSSSGRYAAIAERYLPAGEHTSPRPMGSGVAVLDVEDKISSLAQRGSRITIFDRKHPAEPRRILLNAFALEMRWGPDEALYVSKSAFFSGDASTMVVRILPGAWKMEQVYWTAGRFQSMVPAIHPNGHLMALALDVENRTWEDFQSLLLIDPATGREIRRLSDGLPVLGGDYAWSKEGKCVYARARNGGLDQIYEVPLRGKLRPLTRGPRRHYNLALSPDGSRLAYQTEDGYGRKDIRVYDLDTGTERIVLILDDPAAEFDMGAWRHIRWNSTDGVRPFGFLFLPPDFDSTKRYPLLVDVHGGGEGSRLYLAAPLTIGVAPGPLEWHAWAALGYVVLVPDYRSTGGYGPEVIRARYDAGEPGAIQDIEDIRSGTRFLIQQGFIEPSKVAILGHSAGAQRVFVLLTRHNLYTAAILNEMTTPDPVSLVTRLTSGRNTGDYPVGLFRQLYGGELAEVPERYKMNYLFDSYRVTTPTLIMVGNEELGGVLHTHNEVLYSILRQNGTPVRMLEFVEEGHTYSRPESAKIAFEEARSWLQAHMGPNR